MNWNENHVGTKKQKTNSRKQMLWNLCKAARKQSEGQSRMPPADYSKDRTHIVVQSGQQAHSHCETGHAKT